MTEQENCKHIFSFSHSHIGSSDFSHLDRKPVDIKDKNNDREIDIIFNYCPLCGLQLRIYK